MKENTAPKNSELREYELHRLQDELSLFLGRDFLEKEVAGYAMVGKKRHELEKIKKKSHPLGRYLSELNQAIAQTNDSKKTVWNSGAIFILRLTFMLKKCKEVKGIEIIHRKLKDMKMFSSACHELEVASYYVDLGHEVVVIPESSHKTPDFMIKTKEGGAIYAEAKLLEDVRVQEDNQWDLVSKKIDSLLMRLKMSCYVRVTAFAPLKEIDQERLLNVVHHMLSNIRVGYRTSNKLDHYLIEIERVTEWDREFKNEVELPERNGYVMNFMCSSINNGIDVIISNIRSVSIKRYTRSELKKQIRRNIENANRQATQRHPFIVHVGIPHKESAHILEIYDSAMDHFLGDISRNFKKVNAIVFSAFSLDLESKSENATRNHSLIVPNFNSDVELPSDFLFPSFSTIGQEEFDFDNRHRIDIGYSPDKCIEDLTQNAYGEIFFVCSKNAKSQLRLILTGENAMRLCVISPKIGKIDFDCPVATREFIEGKTISFEWQQSIGRIEIDSREIRRFDFKASKTKISSRGDEG